MQRIVVGIALAALTAASVCSQPAIVMVEDWSRHRVGTTGVPDGWKGQDWGSPRYDFVVAAGGAGKVLRLRSQGDSSTVSKEIKVDVKHLPLLVWRWKMVTLPPGGDCRRKQTDDEAGQVYVTFPRFPAKLRSRIIGYVWDTTAPAGTIVASPSSGLVTYVVVRSGAEEIGRWVTETRNVYDDYKRIYGVEPREDVGAVSVAIDSDDTRSRAESFVGEIFFRAQ